jgi:hypothetical protein
MGEPQRGEAGGDDDRRPIPVVISEDTPVKMRVVIALVATGVTVLLSAGGVIWWASGISHQMDTIIAQQAAIVAAQNTMQATINGEIKSLKEDVSELKSWHKMIDQQGDPAGRVRDENLQNQITRLQHDFDVDQAKKKP